MNLMLLNIVLILYNKTYYMASCGLGRTDFVKSDGIISETAPDQIRLFFQKNHCGRNDAITK